MTRAHPGAAQWYAFLDPERLAVDLERGRLRRSGRTGRARRARNSAGHASRAAYVRKRRSVFPSSLLFSLFYNSSSANASTSAGGAREYTSLEGSNADAAVLIFRKRQKISTVPRRPSVNHVGDADRRARDGVAHRHLLMYVRAPSSARALAVVVCYVVEEITRVARLGSGSAVPCRTGRAQRSCGRCRFRRSDEGNAAVAAPLTIGTLRTASRTSSWFTFLPLR